MSRRRIGRSSEFTCSPGGKSVFPSMTVAQNLEMGAYMYRKDPADRQRRTHRVLELFPGLAAKLADRADSLSGGQQQMLGLARALLHDPRDPPH